MLREGWNFHNDIALTLEYYARSTFGYPDRPAGTIFDADAIEGGTFVEVMMLILRKKTDYTNEISEIYDFAADCGKCYSASSNAISDETADYLFKQFIELYKKY